MGLAQSLVIEPFAWLEAIRNRAGAGKTASKPSARGALEFSFATSRADLAALEPEWDALCKKSGGAAQMFLGFNWLWHWCAHYLDAKGASLAVLAARRNGELVVVWPMLVEDRMGLKTAAFAGCPVSQYGDILVDRNDPNAESLVAESWRHFLREIAPDVVHLRKLRSDSVIVGLMRRIGAHQTNVQAAPYIVLAGEPSFEAFDERFSAKDRKNRRRKRKRLGELGRVGFRRSAGSAAAVAAFRQAMAWKRGWMEDEAIVSAALADQRFDSFFETALTSADRPVGAEIFELTLDDKPVAIKLALTSGSHRGMHLTAYDRGLDKCSPGTLLVEEMIGAGLADDLTTLDFLAPAFDYKLEWATGTVEVSDYCVAVSAKGRLYDSLYVRRLRPHLRRLLAEGPAPVRRLVARLVKAANTAV